MASVTAAPQLRPGCGDAVDVPAELGRLGGEAVARHGRDHQVEGVLGRAAVRVGSVSGPTTPSISMTEPGQPWVMMSGKALRCWDFTWMK
jgi:hypothetical protein